MPKSRDERKEVARDVVETGKSTLDFSKETLGKKAYEIGFIHFHCPECLWTGKLWKASKKCRQRGCRGILVRSPGNVPLPDYCYLLGCNHKSTVNCPDCDKDYCKEHFGSASVCRRCRKPHLWTVELIDRLTKIFAHRRR
jgi:hypothetical protein